MDTVKRFEVTHLFEPAIQLFGSVPIRSDTLHKLRVLESATRLALEESFGFPVATTLESLDTSVPDFAGADCPFGLRITHPRGSCTIGVDRELARGLVEIVGRETSAFKRPGPLTEAERGMLYFASLKALDHLATKHSFPAGLECFLEPSTVAKEFEGDATFLRYRVWLRGRTGCLFVRSSGDLDDLELKTVPSNARQPIDSFLSLRLFLPCVSLSLEEQQALSPGDLILLGVSDLKAAHPPPVLATETQWQLGLVSILEDHPRSVRIRMETVAPKPEPSHPSQSAHDLRAYLGTAQVTASQLAEWEPGTELELTKPTDAPVLIETVDCAYRGEFVKASGELAVRFVDYAGDNSC